MIAEFKSYFPASADPRLLHSWVHNPFVNEREKNSLSRSERDQLIGKCSYRFIITRSAEFTIHIHLFLAELTTDSTLRNMFGTCELDEFWLNVEGQYQELSKKAINLLLQFSTTYLSETAFSTHSLIKTKQRNRVNAKSAMILAISKIEPRFKALSQSVLKGKRTCF